MARLPSVLHADHLALAELCAARLDGELMPIGAGWCPVDEPDLPALRAAAVAPGLTAPLIVERRSAAWVHGALAVPPTVAECCVPHTDRVSVRGLPQGLVLREVAIGADEIVSLGGVRCTSLDRTVYDLVRDPGVGAVEAVDVVAALFVVDPASEARVRARIERSARMPHRSTALARLGAARGAQPSLTR